MNTLPLRCISRVSRHSVLSSRQQRGISLFVALTALLLMTVAGLSLMRSVDTANQIAGNMAFRSAGLNASDLGLEAAAAYLHNVVSASPNANIPAGCAIGSAANPPVPAATGNCRYSSRILPQDAMGLPLIDWSSRGNIPVTTVDGNEIQYVVERLCNPDSGVAINLSTPALYDDAVSLCMLQASPADKSAKQGGHGLSKESGGGSVYGRLAGICFCYPEL